MNESIALCANVYNDAAALRGLIETGSRFFDNIFIVHSGPGGALSTDGTIELCEKFGCTIVYDDMQKGFGHIRSRLIHECGCTFGFILDADERFLPQCPVIHCEGVEHYPQHPKPNLSVFHKKDVINQGAHIRNLMADPEIMAIRTTRRHWFDFGMRHPTQNWLLNQDHQLRIVRNVPEISYRGDQVMHERLIDSRTGGEPKFAEQDAYGGPFHDHFHMVYRTAYPGTKDWNERQYDRLSKGEKMQIKQFLHHANPALNRVR